MDNFNEETLMREIERTWGSAGAHMDVFKGILKKAQAFDEILMKVEEDDVKLYKNRKNGKTYKVFSLTNDSTNSREGIQYAIYLDDDNKLQFREFKEFSKKFDEI